MKTYNISRMPPVIRIGYDGENNWRPQAFDCTPLLQNHPNGTITLWILPEGETQAFPVALERDGNTVIWTPLSEEMTAATGAFQIVCTDGTDVGKSAVVMFRVDESILPGADHPAAVPSWATQTVERAEDAAQRAEEAAESIDIEALEAQIAQAVEDYLEEHPVEAPVQSVNGKTGAVNLDASDVHALPDSTVIPAAVTEQTVSDWGFTKNTGTYSKPTGGIPKTDLASDVQMSLGKADTALQQHQSLAGYATEQWVGNQGYQTAPFAINIYEENGSWYCSATPAQLVANAKNCYITVDGDDNARYFPSGTEVSEDGLSVFLSCIIPQNGSESDDWSNDIITISWYDGEDVIVQVGTIAASNDNPSASGTAFAGTSLDYARGDHRHPKELPAVTAADNGKSLVVVNGAWAASGALQTKAITDTGGYFTTDTVEGALQEIGAELAGINTLIGTGVIS